VLDSRNRELLDLRNALIPRGVANTHPISIARAQGAKVWDVDSREYIDFTGGIGVLNVGHNHPRVVQAVQAQMERLTHISFQVAPYEPYIRLAQRLTAATRFMGETKALFLTTGAEATENAVKIARAYTGRPGVVTFRGSFHGRTLMGLSLTGKVHPYKQNFGPFASEVYHSPFPYSYRGWSWEEALAALDDLFKVDVEPGHIAAIMLEPVLGEGGFIPAPFPFLTELRKICDHHGILLIADEIQTGFARTGKLFAVEHSGVAPDLLTFAKSVAGGLPLSGVIGRSEVMDAPAPGGLGGTYGGNPLACVAGLAVLEVIESEGLLERADHLGQTLVQAFSEMQSREDAIGDVRGLGAMVAIELVTDRTARTPAPDLTQQIIREAQENGLLLLSAGLYGNVIRVLVPLTATDEEISEGLQILGRSLAACSPQCERRRS
jgi:4-aminobutyrate aminotransferase/(S)-3-amino-2-methylpropionate transaminase